MAQVSEYVCRLDPVDDVLNIVTMPAQGGQLDVIQRSVILAQVTTGHMTPGVGAVEAVNSTCCLPAAHPATRSAEIGGLELLGYRDPENLYSVCHICRKKHENQIHFQPKHVYFPILLFIAISIKVDSTEFKFKLLTRLCQFQASSVT